MAVQEIKVKIIRFPAQSHAEYNTAGSRFGKWRCGGPIGVINDDDNNIGNVRVVFVLYGSRNF